MANFGKHPRPGDEPPPRAPLTHDQLRIRETFNRDEHLRSERAGTGGSPQPSQPPQQPNGFDEQSARLLLAQVGMDLQVFPIGEKPLDPSGRNAYREQRLTQLESDFLVMRDRAVAAESAAGGSVRELNELKVRFDTLQGELESLKASRSKKKET